MSVPIALIVGLGNPGQRYARTRHNAGCQFLDAIAGDVGAVMSNEPKFDGRVGTAHVDGISVRLLAPETYMNHSGDAVAKLVRFYKIPIAQILVVHDDLDLPPGVARLKRGGGHGGHNGLKSIFACLGSPEFARLRIGIGRPAGTEDATDFVLKRPTAAEAERIDAAMQVARRELPKIVRGEFELAMNVLHDRNEVRGSSNG